MRRIAVALTLIVTFAGVAVALPTAPARAATPTVISFPWVPNNETIGGQGPWYGEVAFQNLSSASCALSVLVGKNGTWIKTAQLSLTGGSSRSVSSSSMAVPSPGAPVRIEAFCPLAASLKQYTPKTINSPWSDGASVVAGHTGLAQVELATAHATPSSAWFLPIVQTNSDWNTFIRVANLTTTTPIDVTIELFPNGNVDGGAGADWTMTSTVAVGATWTVDAQAVLARTGWVGFARIRSTGDSGVIALRSKASTAMAMTNVGVAGDGSTTAIDHRTYAPLLFNAYNGWNTGINLANVSPREAEITVQYYEAGGGLIRTDNLTLPALSMQYIYTPGDIAQTGFVGSATIISTAPVVAAIDEVKYETTEALSYMSSCLPQHDASIPVVFREDASLARHDNSGINIVNVSPDTEQTVQIRLLSTSGADLLPTSISVVIPPGGNSFVYLPFVDGIPAGTVASARLTSTHPSGFVAISNDINYVARGDGSVVFVASSSSGYYLIPGSTPTAAP